MEPWAVIITICGRSPSASSCEQLAHQLEAGHARHHVVDDDQIEVALGEVALRVARARRFDDVVTLVAQRPAQALEDLLFVVGQEDGAVAPALMPAFRRDTGRSIRTSVPSPGGWSPQIMPPSPSTMFLAIGSPSPVPARRVVK